MNEHLLRRKHRGSRRQFWLANKTIHVEVFWHYGKKTSGAEIYHVPSGNWEIVFGRLGQGPKKPLFRKIRQMAVWLANPEVREVSKRILGRKETRKQDALFWADEVANESIKF